MSTRCIVLVVIALFGGFTFLSIDRFTTAVGRSAHGIEVQRVYNKPATGSSHGEGKYVGHRMCVRAM